MLEDENPKKNVNKKSKLILLINKLRFYISGTVITVNNFHYQYYATNILKLVYSYERYYNTSI